MSRVRRIVSLVPSFTEIVYFLGLGGRLAGVTEHCDYPGEARTRGQGGHISDGPCRQGSFLKPTWSWRTRSLHRPWVTELRNAGLEVLARSFASVEDVFGVMDRIVQLCGVEDTGRERINSLREKVEQLRRAASRKRPRVFCLMRTDPVITPGPGSFQYDALEIAGARLMVFQTQEPYVEVSPEQIVAFDPEVVVFCGVEKGERKPRDARVALLPYPSARERWTILPAGSGSRPRHSGSAGFIPYPAIPFAGQVPG